jgi:uroporphyrinogen III methyltransferase/synthase
VDVVDAYQTRIPDDAARRETEIFSGPHKPDWITFTSSSTVRNFAQIAGIKLLEGVKVASIGPVTTASTTKLGIEVTVEASPHTTEGIIATILQHVSGG